jgi:hypothetical protein
MKTSTRNQATAALTQSIWTVAIGLSCLVVLPLSAAETEKEDIAQAASTNFTVAQSTPVDKLIQKFYAFPMLC